MQHVQVIPPKISEKIRWRHISVFHFTPVYVSYLLSFRRSINQLLPMVAVGLKFVDWVAGSSGHEQYPFRGGGGQTHRWGQGSGRGELRLHHLSPIPCYISKTGPLSTNLWGRVTAPEVFCTSSICRYCACAQHAFPVSRKILGRLRPDSVYWVTDMGEKEHLSHFKFRSWTCYLAVHRFRFKK